MITVGLAEDGQVEITAEPSSPAHGWLASLAADEFFSSRESELSVGFRPSDEEEFNEDWDEYALPEIVSKASEWRESYAPASGRIRFPASAKLEVAGYLNRARLKIAMEGTGDVLPPPESAPRRAQYEFLTALMEFVLSIPEDLRR